MYLVCMYCIANMQYKCHLKVVDHYEGYRYLVVTWYVYSKCNLIWFCKMNEVDPDVFLNLGFGNPSLFFKPPKPRTIIL